MTRKPSANIDPKDMHMHPTYNEQVLMNKLVPSINTQRMRGYNTYWV